VILDNRSLVVPYGTGQTSSGTGEGLDPESLSPGSRPFVRFVGGSNVSTNLPLLSDWARLVCQWVSSGKTPHFFVHTSDDKASPNLARIFHELLSSRIGVGTMPDWPGEVSEKQLTLF
jgi:hypothetical protein